MKPLAEVAHMVAERSNLAARLKSGEDQEFISYMYTLDPYGFLDYPWTDEFAASKYSAFLAYKAEQAKPTLEQRVAALEKQLQPRDSDDV